MLTDRHSKYCGLYPTVDGKPFKIFGIGETRLVQHFIFFTLITVGRVDFKGRVFA